MMRPFLFFVLSWREVGKEVEEKQRASNQRRNGKNNRPCKWKSVFM
jgi:hypothetical protein